MYCLWLCWCIVSDYFDVLSLITLMYCFWLCWCIVPDYFDVLLLIINMALFCSTKPQCLQVSRYCFLTPKHWRRSANLCQPSGNDCLLLWTSEGRLLSEPGCNRLVNGGSMWSVSSSCLGMIPQLAWGESPGNPMLAPENPYEDPKDCLPGSVCSKDPRLISGRQQQTKCEHELPVTVDILCFC